MAASMVMRSFSVEDVRPLKTSRVVSEMLTIDLIMFHHIVQGRVPTVAAHLKRDHIWTVLHRWIRPTEQRIPPVLELRRQREVVRRH
jgi:hypothetical protein